MTKFQQVEQALAKRPLATVRELSAATGIEKDTVRRYVYAIRKQGNRHNKTLGTNADEPLRIDSYTAKLIKLRGLLKAGDAYTIPKLSDVLDIGVSKVSEMLDTLKSEGYLVNITKDTVSTTTMPPSPGPLHLNLRKMQTGEYKFGVVGDNHLGSKYERLDVLNALYDEFQRQGISIVFNTGNWIDGEAKFNTHDLHGEARGVGGQVDYFVRNYPKRKGVKTLFIAGDDHEGWYQQRERIEIGAYAELLARQAGREDLIYTGYMESDYVLPEGTIIRSAHPGGGSAYAVSYTGQKIVESYQGGEKPHVLLIGHYHKAEYLYNRGVHIIQTGCTQDQTPFMRKKRLAAHLGGWTFSLWNDKNGAIIRFASEFFPFYDNEYYQKWFYKK